MPTSPDPSAAAAIRQEQLAVHFVRPHHPLQCAAFTFSRYLMPRWLRERAALTALDQAPGIRP